MRYCKDFFKMILYLRHSEINKNKWDNCMNKADYSIIYGYSWYLDIVSPGWDALVEGDYEAIFPITWKRKYLICYITQPMFAQQLGIFSRVPLKEQQITDFFSLIPQKFLHFNITLNPSNQSPTSSCYTVSWRKTYHVPLNQPYENIYRCYTNNTKKNLRRSWKHDFILSQITVDEVIDLYKQNVWFKTPAIKLTDYELLHRLSKEVALRHKCIVLGAFVGNTLSAGAIFFVHDNKIIFIFGSSNKTGRKNGAMRYIFDHMIRSNCNKDLVLDFEGSSIDSVEYVYKSFGSTKLTFSNIVYDQFNLLGKAISQKQRITNFITTKRIIQQERMKTGDL